MSNDKQETIEDIVAANREISAEVVIKRILESL